MAYRSKVFYTGTGSEQNLSVTFPYLDISHVHVYFDEVLQEDSSWSWLNSSTITLTATVDAVVEIRRATGTTPLVDFTNGSLLNEDDQNMAYLQAIYLIEEGMDYIEIVEMAVDDFNLSNNTFAVTFIIDGGSNTITKGEKGHIQIPFPCTIQGVYAYADQTGSIVVDIWKDTHANFPPTNADSICSATPVTIAAGVKASDVALTGWTVDIDEGDVLAYNVDSCTSIRRVTVTLVVEK